METLDREVVTEQFNARFLGINVKKEPKSELDSFIGYEPTWGNGLQDISRDVFTAMRDYPIFKTFGLTYKDCMSLPMDEWLALIREAQKIPKEEPLETQILSCLKAVLPAATNPQ